MLKPVLRSVFFLLFALSSNYAFFSSMQVERLWQKVNQAEQKKLPKTALEHLKEIRSTSEDNPALIGHYLKAVAHIALNQAHILGKKPEDKLEILRKELDSQDEQYRPILKTITAIWFWHYYEQNQWRFNQRSATSGYEDNDFTKWDSNKLFQEVGKLLDEVLIHAHKLEGIELENLSPVVQRGSLSFKYCDNLYEFILRQMIEFYTKASAALPKPEDAFEIDSNSDAFGDLKTFLDYEPKTTDSSSPLLKSLKAYQILLRQVIKRGDKDALVSLEVERFQFMEASGVGGNKNEILMDRFSELASTYKAYKESTLASYHHARLLQADEDLVKAHEICTEAKRAFPSSDGASLCHNLVGSIEQKSYSARVEYSINEFNREIFLKYRNVTRLYFRVVQDDWKRFMKKKWRGIGDHLNDEDLDELLRKTPVAEFSLDLEPTSDFKEKDAEARLPELKRGYYRLLVSEHPDFAKVHQNQVVHAAFFETDTVVLLRNQGEDQEGLVVEADEGKPISGAEVQVYERNREGRYYYGYSMKTDANGFFRFERGNRERYGNYIFFVKAPKTGDVLYYRTNNFSYKGHRGVQKSVRFFTDRSIYRPGQTIRFKGICYKSDHRSLKYEPMHCGRVTVRLRDANYQEISKEVFSTNEFGSFAGEFLAPRDVLTGQMTLQASSPSGSVSFRVEEYKRPKFEVKLEEPEKEYKLGEQVIMSGEAKTYSGVAIGDAKVKYRVVRQVRMPWWWRWGNPFSGSREITHGEVKTGEDGKFEIPFEAVPDRRVDPEMKPTFSYQVEVDVVDQSGETRSDSRSIRLGYVSLEAKMSMKSWLEANQEHQLSISTQTLGGQGVDNEGVIEIYELIQPAKPIRKPSEQNRGWWWYWRAMKSGGDSNDKDLSSIENWKKGELRETLNYKTKAGNGSVSFRLPPGAYRAILKTKDSFSNEVVSKESFLTFDSSSQSFDVKVPAFFKIKSSTVEVGSRVEAFFGTGYENAQIHVAFEREHKTFKSYWTNPGTSSHKIDFPVGEDLKGGFSLLVRFVHENQFYTYRTFINVPFSEKKLKLSWETFRSKLRPGAKEVWTLKVEGSNAEAFAAEMVATLYDASLDAFYPHNYQDFSHIFWRDSMAPAYIPNLHLKSMVTWFNRYHFSHRGVNRSYPDFPWEIKNGFQYLFPPQYGHFGGIRSSMMMKGAAMPMAEMADSFSADEGMMEEKEASVMAQSRAPGVAAKKMKRSRSNAAAAPAEGDKAEEQSSEPEVKVRSNLNETAFFFPQLVSNEDGVVRMEFQMPEALTRWRFLAVAHGKGMESALHQATVVTQKELMIDPNAPRFLRQGDLLNFPVKVSNLSEEIQEGSASIQFLNPLNNEDVTSQILQGNSSGDFSVKPGQSQVVKFALKVPEVSFPLQYKVIAKSQSFADGEEGILPVLSKRVLVRESKPLWVRGPGKKKFAFDKLIESMESSTLKHEKLVVQMTSNPAWYVVMALPYLSEYPYECSEQIFNRMYANHLGLKIVDDNPKIERIFKLWKGTETLDSPLEKNQDLKAVLLQETPWVTEAQNEKKARARVANFFDKNKMNHELKRSFETLEKRQLSDGSWPWFPGGRSSEYITLYLVTGFGRLRDLGVNIDDKLAIKALHYLDRWIKEKYDWIIRHADPDKIHYSNTIAMYLYGRSFFLKDKPVLSSARQAVDYFLGQALKHWTSLDNRMGEGHTALGTLRFGQKQASLEIMKSLRERALHDEEMGMYWGDQEFPFYWYRAPIETQALMVEVFQELGNEKEVEDLKVWLLKQKQTQDWKTTKATADAVFALLRRGDDLLASDEIVKVSLGGEDITPEKVEAGTGYYEKRYTPAEIRSEMGNVELTKNDKGISWGGVYWQYFEDLDKVTPHQTPLQIEKKLFVRRNTKAGPVIEPIEKSPLKIGDTMVVRLVLRVDRAMEYVHLKDMRGAGTEPVNVLSYYKYQDGLAYYESTKDTASHFFMDYLPKGTYVFEYDLKVFHSGTYQGGLAEIQCMYAPEFNAHSEGFLLEVGE